MTALPKVSMQFKRALESFLVEEAPYLLPFVEGLEHPEEIQERLTNALEKMAHTVGSEEEIYPGHSRRDAVDLWLNSRRITVEGFFRRWNIRQSITRAERLVLFRTMLLTRALDDSLKQAFDRKEIRWKNYPSPQKGFRSTGQEAIVGAALRLRRPPLYPSGSAYEGDIIAPMIRDLGALLMFMPDPAHPLMVQYGKSGTPVGGRDLHVGDLEQGVLPAAAPLAIATQTLTGIAYGFKLRGEDRVCLSFIGDGGSSLGEWHEAINFAGAKSLNMVFIIENNLWALGTHVSEQCATDRFAHRGAAYGIPGISLFGNDPDEVASGVSWAVERARSGEGPTLLELKTYRRSGHAHHDDDRFHGTGAFPGYEFKDDRRRWEQADPIDLYERRLRDQGVLDEDTIEKLWDEVRQEVQQATERARSAPWPEPEDYRSRVYAESNYHSSEEEADPKNKVLAYDEAIREGISSLMEVDPTVLVLGEDVGGRYGGAFGVTRGLAKRFGEIRCLNTPLAESAIVGCGVGAALMGFKPVVEIQFADFLACGFNALVNNAAKIFWRWGKTVPMVVRLPYGGATGTPEKLLGGGPFHSQCPEMWFVRTPGWKVVAPSCRADAKGLMLAAIRDPNPVLFLEAKGLYGFFRPDLREAVPMGTEPTVELGQAKTVRSGTDLTLLTYGPMVWTALRAAEMASEKGVEVEILDLRSLWPLDEEAIEHSVKKTHRVLLLHEDTLRGGFGAELAARIAEDLFFYLDAPIRRLGSPDTPIPYSPPLEHDFLPNADKVLRAVLELNRL